MTAGGGTTTKQDEVRWTVLLAVGLAALLGLRLIALTLNGTDLFFDEAQYWSWSQAPDFGYYSKPPLIAWIIRGATEVCGHGEACIRMPSPIIHTMTALVVFLIGRRLYGAMTGVFAALAFATLPGVSVSSGIISTDVPLLFFWALALYALTVMFDDKSWCPALLLGVALGGGLNAKYAMVWFVLCLAVYLVATPGKRWILKDARLWVAGAIGGAMILPNVLWNVSHKFATLSHTADNANWQGSLLNPAKALEFFGAQFGVFGPILFAGLLVIAWRAWREGLPAPDRILLSFALPVVIVITVQAFLSRAHANWAAVSYVSATLLVVATMVRDLDWAWLRRSMVLHAFILLALVVATTFAGRIVLPGGASPFARTLGWEALVEATRAELDAARAKGQPFAAVLADDRSVTAELLYYMRDEPTPVRAWKSSLVAKDHYQLTRPFKGATTGPVLLVSLGVPDAKITESFAHAETFKRSKIAAGAGKNRTVSFTALEGLKEQ
ncbi:MAG: ArnT family glycosyltransferase [Hyphomicrobiaceae bacterium]